MTARAANKGKPAIKSKISLPDKGNLKIDIKAGFEFDPEWTFDQAHAAGADSPFSPFFRWTAWNELVRYKQQFEQGDKECVITALYKCACHNLPMPNWLADAYCEGFHAWVNYRASSLDEAFGVQIPKGKHINKLRRLRILKFKVPNMVEECRAGGDPVDQGLFDAVGQRLGISGGTAKDIFYNHNPFRQLGKKKNSRKKKILKK